ncbi:MAG: hypothetical protein R3F59_12975 [Myxococcota bacterium]
MRADGVAFVGGDELDASTPTAAPRASTLADQTVGGLSFAPGGKHAWVVAYRLDMEVAQLRVFDDRHGRPLHSQLLFERRGAASWRPSIPPASSWSPGPAGACG